jgi:hypothetical protein
MRAGLDHQIADNADSSALAMVERPHGIAALVCVKPQLLEALS